MSHALTRISDFLVAWNNKTDEYVIATVNGVSLYAYDLRYLADRAADDGNLDGLGLSVQAYNALRRGGIRTVDQLTARTRQGRPRASRDRPRQGPRDRKGVGA